MTVPDSPAVATEEWLARWAEAASQCWGRVGTCCRSCRVEALDPPEPQAACAVDEPAPAPDTPDDRATALSAAPGGQNDIDSTNRRAA